MLPAADIGRVLTPLSVQTLVLLALAFQGVTLVLYTLARRLQHDVARHDLIRGARLRRIEYLSKVDDRREALRARQLPQKTRSTGGSSSTRFASPALPDSAADSGTLGTIAPAVPTSPARAA